MCRPMSSFLRVSRLSMVTLAPCMFRRYDIVNEDDLRQAMGLRAKYHEATASKVISMGQP
jgi:hypothetical protein